MTDRDDLDFARRIAEPLREPESLEPGFEARLLSRVRAAADRGEALWMNARGRRRRFGWLVAPRSFAVSPLAGLAVAAGFAALVAMATLALNREPRLEAASDNSGQVVHFAIAAPAANTVTLVGDFNGWNPKTTRMTKGAVEGLWIATIPLAAGSYQYAFVIDDTTWLADPAGSIALEDEFGTPSSVVTIGGSRT